MINVSWVALKTFSFCMLGDQPPNCGETSITLKFRPLKFLDNDLPVALRQWALRR